MEVSGGVVLALILIVAFAGFIAYRKKKATGPRSGAAETPKPKSGVGFRDDSDN